MLINNFIYIFNQSNILVSNIQYSLIYWTNLLFQAIHQATNYK
jgi:hypothetical protein